MALGEVQIPYNDFQMGEFIDPEQHDTNNFYLQSKINEIVLLINRITDSIEDGKSGADTISLTPIAPFASNKLQAYLEEVITRLRSTTKGTSGADFIASTTIAGVTGNTVQAQLESLRALLTTEVNRITTLTGRVGANETAIANRYTKAEVDAKDTAIQTQVTTNKNALTTVQIGLTNHNHDSRYMTRAELTPYLQGGDTVIHIDVFTIETSNNGDGTFSYRDKNNTLILGSVGMSGEQIFTLSNKYSVGMNHIKAIVGDTLQRSVASGGLKEIDATHVALTYPEAPGTEITIEYYERLGVTGEHNIVYSPTMPPPTNGSTMWFKVVG